MEFFDIARATLNSHPGALAALQLVGPLLTIWLVDLLTNSVLLRAMSRAVLTLAPSFANLLNAIGQIYEQRDPERACARPIKG